MLLLGVVALLSLLPAASEPTWPRGVVNVYDASGMTDTVMTAAYRWSRSGADVEIRIVKHPDDADVIVRADDRRLHSLCGSDCLGYSTSIGRPDNGHAEVLLREDLGGHPRPLSVWVAAHELGHILGLRHRDGDDCSVMAARAFDTDCAPSLAATRPTAEELACVPAPADVDVAAALYGGAAAPDPRCR